MWIENFGRNIRFQPAERIEPTNEAELLEMLAKRTGGPIRVHGAKHSWSPLIETEGLAISLARFNSVTLHHDAAGGVSAEIGAGCRIKDVLAELNRHGLTLPSVGLITEQCIAGAVSTGTHGSGRHSLSHYVDAVRLLHHDAESDQWQFVTIDQGDDLRAARCSLGCLGILVSVRMPCRRQYYVDEVWARYRTLDEVLNQVERYPLQQFYLLPHCWDWLAQHRLVDEAASARSGLAWLYRWYFHLTFDWGMHLAIALVVRGLRSRRLTRWLFRVLPRLVIQGWRVRDRSDRQLVMEHELFRHLETELFVPESVASEAARYVASVLRVADGEPIDACDPFRERLMSLGAWTNLEQLRGCFTHHYPICFRRVLPDDTLLSATAGDNEPRYAISLITYAEPRDDFFQVAEFLATTMTRLFDARLHWGKHLPLTNGDVRGNFPSLERFQQVMRRYDPRGRFQNQFTASMLTEANPQIAH